VLTTGLAGRVVPGVTALVNYRLADLGLGSTLVRDTQTLAAVAWRPEHSDRSGLLFSWNHGNQDGGYLTTDGGSRVGRLSGDGYVAPGRGVELHSRVALIRMSDGSPSTTTNAYLWQGRVQQRLTSYLDVAVEERISWQTGLASSRSVLGAEIGIWALKDLRIGLGYRTRPIDQNGLPVLTAPKGRGLYLALSTRLAGFFNLLGSSSADATGRKK
jgi:hypothetical protein